MGELKEVIVENNEIVNLEKLMEDAEWFDNLSEEPIVCGSHRSVVAKLGDSDVAVLEIHRCGRPFARIILRLNGKSLLDYKKPLEYRRCPHERKLISIKEEN